MIRLGSLFKRLGIGRIKSPGNSDMLLTSRDLDLMRGNGVNEAGMYESFVEGGKILLLLAYRVPIRDF